MSAKNGTKEEPKTKDGQLMPEAIFAAWMAEGGIELAVERVVSLRAIVTEAVTASRAAAKAAEEEIRAKNAAMEAKFAALGGIPPLDDAEAARAKAAGVRHVKPKPPADDTALKSALVQRILVLKRDRPKDDPPTTRGLAKWSGAPGQRIDVVLKDAAEVQQAAGGRWIPRET